MKNRLKLLYLSLGANFSLKVREEKKIDDLNEQLEKALKREEIERALLKNKISKYVRKGYGVHLSKFIPRKKHNKTEIFIAVHQKFGDEMDRLSLVLNKNLTWR